jgi:hypothetical protein
MRQMHALSYDFIFEDGHESFFFLSAPSASGDISNGVK